MMKAHYKTANGRLTFEVQAENVKTLFREISAIQEVFDAETHCGCCQGIDIRFQARAVEDFDFYELACNNQECRARFSFGQAKKGGALFPKRKDEDGRFIANRGWVKYVPKKQASGAGGPPVRDENDPF